MANLMKLLGQGIILVLAAFLILWVGLSVHYQLAPTPSYLAYGVLALFSLLLIGWAVKGNWGTVIAGMALVGLVYGIWWSTIAPRQDRNWQPDVARGVTAEISGDRVTLHNVRNFDWITEDEAVERWETRSYDPNTIISVDLFLSVWSSPAIAHSLVSFGFANGEHVVFSGEIRKEKGEVFSSIGGFFKEFELALIAADERDIVRLRTDARGEQVSLYPVAVPPALRKELFLSYARLGNELAAAPAWYNTATTNCTTVPYRLVRHLIGGIPFSIEILLSGWLPDYLYRLGVLPQGLTLDQIKARAPLGRLGPAGDDGIAFSERLRANWRG